MKIFKSKKAYTLLELVIYLALFAVLSLVLVRVTVTGYNVYKTIRINRDFTEHGLTAIDTISRAVRNASSVSASSTLSASPGVLALTNSTGTTTFDVSNSALRETDVTASGTTVGDVTGGKVTVSSLIFEKITTTKSQAVKTKITLIHTPTGRTESFYVTTVLRGSY